MDPLPGFLTLNRGIPLRPLLFKSEFSCYNKNINIKIMQGATYAPPPLSEIHMRVRR